MGDVLSIGSRIKEIRGSTSVAEFCRVFGIHRNTLPRWESGERTPDGETLAEICNKYDIDANWLLLGKGEKDRIVTPPSDIDEEILLDAIEGLEEAMAAKNRVFSPAKKAEIITELYMILLEEEQEEDQQNKRTNLAKILKLVA